MVGVAANGAPYFKSQNLEQYLYYDLSCNGAENGVARWIIGPKEPNASRTEDLDQDGACNYHAHLDTSENRGPPATGSWSMYCGHDWEERELKLMNPDNKPTYNSSGVPGVAPHFVIHGKFCSEKSFLNDLRFDLVGTTASGAPFYQSVPPRQYIYYDPACDGNNQTSARWVIDAVAPDLDRKTDLNGGACKYHARLYSEDWAAPPTEAAWRIYCDGVWQNVWVSMDEPPLEKPKEEESAGQDDNTSVVISVAEGLRGSLAVVMLSAALLTHG